jgi:hypothetical protein
MSYVATAKGPLPSSTTFKDQGLGFPGHLIIATIAHESTITAAAMGEEIAAITFKEMTRFREAIQAMISTKTTRKLGTVAWEICRGRNIHAHWQVVPVPIDLIRKGLVEAGFRVQAENQKLPMMEAKDFGLGDEVESDYFRVWIWGEADDAEGGHIISKSLLMRFDESTRFDLQFGRRVLARLLGVEHRGTWQEVEQAQEEEAADVEAFRKAFNEWDFTE